jgi:hypothetical protein
VNAAGGAAQPEEGVGMKFMLLLWGDESQWEGMSEEEAASEMAHWDEYTKQLTAAGALVSGEGLQPSASSKLLRLEDGERIVTDGPFVESKEQLGGFYVIDCASFDEALDWASKLPSAARGSTEIRPVMDYEAVGSEEHSNETKVEAPS